MNHYQDIQQKIDSLHLSLSPAELQARACALACLTDEVDAEFLLFDEYNFNPPHEVFEAVDGWLKDFAIETKNSLEDQDFVFRFLLPEDEDEEIYYAEVIAWCSSFKLALAEYQKDLAIDPEFADEESELIENFFTSLSTIAETSIEEFVDNEIEDNEEILEFLRLGLYHTYFAFGKTIRKAKEE